MKHLMSFDGLLHLILTETLYTVCLKYIASSNLSGKSEKQFDSCYWQKCKPCLFKTK